MMFFKLRDINDNVVFDKITEEAIDCETLW